MEKDRNASDIPQIRAIKEKRNRFLLILFSESLILLERGVRTLKVEGFVSE